MMSTPEANSEQSNDPSGIIAVFDEDIDQGDLRELLVREALSRITAAARADGRPDPFAGFEVRNFQERGPMLIRLRRYQRVLMLADMYSEHKASLSGAIGARLLRGLAQHPDWQARTWRVLWTRQDHPDVAAQISPYAHAYVQMFRDARINRTTRNLEILVRALPEIVRYDPVPGDADVVALGEVADTGARPCLLYGAAFEDSTPETRSSWQEAWDDKLSLLLKSKYTSPPKNAYLAVSTIIREYPPREATNLVLRQQRAAASKEERGDYVSSIQQMLDRINAATTSEAAKRLLDDMGWMSQKGIYDVLHERLLEQAAKRPIHAAWADSHDQTLLTQAEDRIARWFITRYIEKRDITHHGNDRKTAQAVIDELTDGVKEHLVTLRAGDDSPATLGRGRTGGQALAELLFALSAETGKQLDIEDVQYAVWTMVDSIPGVDYYDSSQMS